MLLVDMPRSDGQNVGKGWSQCLGIYSYSQLTYIEALYTQKKEDFLHSTANALSYLGGVPRVLITDNLESAVTSVDNYEPETNESFLDFGNHYQTTIIRPGAGDQRTKWL